jgi:hypothetical protein
LNQCILGIFSLNFSLIVKTIMNIFSNLIELLFTAIFCVKQITVYSNLPCQPNDRLQQFTVWTKLPDTVIYCVKQITVYSKLPCQANYNSQQFTVSNKLPFTPIYCAKQITVYSNLPCQTNDRLQQFTVSKFAVNGKLM